VNREELLARLRVHMEEHLDLDPELITEDALLVDDLDVDSLDLLELIIHLKKEFGISVNDGEVKQLLSNLARFLPQSNEYGSQLSDEQLAQVTRSLRVGTIVDFVESRLTATAGR
jgi:acyl carrier protein